VGEVRSLSEAPARGESFSPLLWDRDMLTKTERQRVTKRWKSMVKVLSTIASTLLMLDRLLDVLRSLCNHF